MRRHFLKFSGCTAALFGAILAVSSTGCQTTIGGQTLPSGYYLKDDVQFFPAGPEFLLPETVRAIEQYKQAQQVNQGFGP